MEAAVTRCRLGPVATSSELEEAIRGAELIIEAVPEELEMKLETVRLFDRSAKPGAIFASNTSALSISAVQRHATLSGRDRCIGMHFFNPVQKMRLVEIIRTGIQSEETVATCCAVAHRMQRRRCI